MKNSISLNYEITPDDSDYMADKDLASLSETDFYYTLFLGNISLSVKDKDFSRYLKNLHVFAFLADFYCFTLEFQANRAERLVLPIFTAPEGLVFEYNQNKKTVLLYLSADPFGGTITNSAPSKEARIIEKILTGFLSKITFGPRTEIDLSLLSDAAKDTAKKFLVEQFIKYPSLKENKLIGTKFFPNLEV